MGEKIRIASEKKPKTTEEKMERLLKDKTSEFDGFIKKVEGLPIKDSPEHQDIFSVENEEKRKEVIGDIEKAKSMSGKDIERQIERLKHLSLEERTKIRKSNNDFLEQIKKIAPFVGDIENLTVPAHKIRFKIEKLTEENKIIDLLERRPRTEK